MNAVEHFAGLLPPETVRRLAALRVQRFERRAAELFGGGGGAATSVLDNDEASARVVERWGEDLCGLLNALTKQELVALAVALGMTGTRAGEAPREDVPYGRALADARSAELRARLWEAGARLERNDEDVPYAVQPRPVLLGGHLVVQAPPRGLFPPSAVWPRPIPPAVPAEPPVEEPETVDDLLAAADRAIGVRLGRRGRDKGAWGSRAQALLGVSNLGDDEPDWRGDVEIKTVPIARDASGLWRVVEDPAIAMVGDGVFAKLQRTLWLARASIAASDGVASPGSAGARSTPDGSAESIDDDATIVSWYLLDWDAEVARLARRYLHERPKGPRGTDARGLYLSKRFFADAGLLASLNGWAT